MHDQQTFRTKTAFPFESCGGCVQDRVIHYATITINITYPLFDINNSIEKQERLILEFSCWAHFEAHSSICQYFVKDSNWLQ